MIKIALWITATAIGIVTLLALLTFAYFWRSPDYFQATAAAASESKIIAQSEYSDNHPNPYIYRSGAVVVFGAEHTKDPNDPQIVRIDQQWRDLRPTAALVEGRLGFLAPRLMDPVKKYGESGHVFDLATRDGIKTYTWEMPQDQLTLALAERHSKERVATFLVLRPYFSNLRYGKPASPEEFVQEYLDRAADPTVEGAVGSVADIDRIWLREFPNGPDWRDVSDEHGLPGYLKTISDDSNDLRNRHLVRAVLELTGKGERLFVVAGSSHAVLIEPALQ